MDFALRLWFFIATFGTICTLSKKFWFLEVNGAICMRCYWCSLLLRGLPRAMFGCCLIERGAALLSSFIEDVWVFALAVMTLLLPVCEELPPRTASPRVRSVMRQGVTALRDSFFKRISLLTSSWRSSSRSVLVFGTTAFTFFAFRNPKLW